MERAPSRSLDDLEGIWHGIFSHAVDDALLAKAAESARALPPAPMTPSI